MTELCSILSPEAVEMYHDDLVALLMNVVNGGASVSYIAPLTAAVAGQFWQDVRLAVQQRRMIVLGLMVDDRLVGSVQLSLAWQPNSPHRAEVQKLLIHSDFRRRGYATRLMTAVEDAARAVNRWLLVLDTQRDSGAHPLYLKLGYTIAGVIPQFALDGPGEEFIDTVVFYKLLQ